MVIYTTRQPTSACGCVESNICARQLLPRQDDGNRRDYKARIEFLGSLLANGSAAGRRRAVQPIEGGRTSDLATVARNRTR